MRSYNLNTAPGAILYSHTHEDSRCSYQENFCLTLSSGAGRLTEAGHNGHLDSKSWVFEVGGVESEAWAFGRNPTAF